MVEILLLPLNFYWYLTLDLLRQEKKKKPVARYQLSQTAVMFVLAARHGDEFVKLQHRNGKPVITSHHAAMYSCTHYGPAQFNSEGGSNENETIPQVQRSPLFPFQGK